MHCALARGVKIKYKKQGHEIFPSTLQSCALVFTSSGHKVTAWFSFWERYWNPLQPRQYPEGRERERDVELAKSWQSPYIIRAMRKLPAVAKDEKL
jgi:hypothetical protein